MTGVKTTAAEAFALRAGVCQDYSHIMISICRLLDIPARYISGHLFGKARRTPGSKCSRLILFIPTD